MSLQELNLAYNQGKDKGYQPASVLAIDYIVRGTRLENEIWENHASSIRIDFEDADFSGSERILANVAIGFWTFGVSSVDLYEMLHRLDTKNLEKVVVAIQFLFSVIKSGESA